MWLALAYIICIVTARTLTSLGRPRRTLSDFFRALLDPTFHFIALASLVAVVVPLLEYLIIRPAQWLPLNIIGGALVSERVKDYTGADAFAPHALAGVRTIRQWIGG